MPSTSFPSACAPPGYSMSKIGQYREVPKFDEPMQPMVGGGGASVVPAGGGLVQAQPVAVPANYVDAAATFAHVPGIMVRQKLFLSQVLCDMLEKRNVYSISAWDPTANSRAPTDEEFAAMPRLLEAREESSCLCRYGCRAARELDVGLFPPNVAEGSGFPPGAGPPMMNFHRPFRCTALCPSCGGGNGKCCDLVNPQEVVVTRADGTEVGRLAQDWRCYEACCRCNQFVKSSAGADGRAAHVWRANMCCCDRATGRCGLGCCLDAEQHNGCAPSCCNRTFTIDILDPAERGVVGSLEVVWPGWNCKGLAGAGFENYVLRFPVDASGDERALMMGGLLLHDYLIFERRKDKK